MTARQHSHLSSAGLLRRQFLAAPVASILLALLVLAGALLATAVPRAVAAMHTAALGERLEGYPARELDVLNSTRAQPGLGPSTSGTTLPDGVDDVWGGHEERLSDIRADMPEPLAAVTGDPLTVLFSGPSNALPEGAAAGGIAYQLFTGFDPRMREHITLTSGEWPEVLLGSPPAEPEIDDGFAGPPAPAPTDEPIEIVFAEPVAAEMGWKLGEVRTLAVGAERQGVRLVGTFDAVDPGDGFWTHVPVALEPSVAFSPDGSLRITGLGFADPNSWAAYVQTQPQSTMDSWFPTLPDRVRADQSAELRAAVDEFTSEAYPLGPGFGDFDFSTVGDVTFSSGLSEALESAAIAAGATDAVLATVASGPIGVMVAVLLLGARVVFERRRTGLELAAARGASDGRLRGILALEGIAIGVPAALVGGALGVLLVPADAGLGGWIIAAVFALTPAALLVASVPALSPLRRTRADVRAGGGVRHRWVAEATVAIIAITAVALLLRRGLATSAAEVGVDPLLAAVPLLLSLLVCLVVLRLYPVPLAALVRRTSRRRDLVPFLGSARALRDPSAGIVPVLTVVVGVSVAVFSAVLLGTVQTGVERAADARVGADAAVTGTPFTLEQQAAFAEVPGVEAIAPVYSTAPSTIEIDGRVRTTTLIVVDADEMRRVQAGRAGATPLPEGLGGGGDIDVSPVPVVISQSVADSIEDADTVELDGEEFEALAVVDGRTAYSPRASWVLMDRSHADRFVDSLVPRTVLVRFSPDADADAVTESLVEIAGPEAKVTTPSMLLDDLRGVSTTSGLVLALIAAIVLSSLLTALAIVLTLIVGRPARDRLLPLLATLGLRRRGERALVAWEIGPVVVVALFAGALLGAALPFVVLQGVDLRSFTGEDAQPVVVFDPALIAAVLTGAVLVTAAAVLLASRIGGDRNASRALRAEEEG